MNFSINFFSVFYLANYLKCLFLNKGKGISWRRSYCTSSCTNIIFIYGLIRPFSSLLARLFTIVGSLFGFLSVSGMGWINIVAEKIGANSSQDLFLYLGLITIFVFILVSWEKYRQLDDKITKLAAEMALERSKNKFR